MTEITELPAVKHDAASGMRGIKQIAESLKANDSLSPETKDEMLARYTFKYINRCYPGWMKEPKE